MMAEMRQLAGARHYLNDIAKALGLNQGLLSASFDFELNKFVKVKVEFFASPDQAKGITEVIKEAVKAEDESVPSDKYVKRDQDIDPDMIRSLQRNSPWQPSQE